jgi:hypothetical protein
VRPCHRPEYSLRPHAADAFKGFEQLALLCRKLRRRRQMLQAAAAADAEVRALRLHPVRRGNQHFAKGRLVHLPAPADGVKAHAFARQRAGDEHRLAVHARNASAVVREIHDVGLARG